MQIRNICKNMSALGQMHCWEMRQFCLKTIVLPEHESKERVRCVALEMQLFHEKRWALIIVKVAETQSEKTLRSYYKQDFHFWILQFLILHCCIICFLLLHITFYIQEISQPLLHDCAGVESEITGTATECAEWGWLWLSLTGHMIYLKQELLFWNKELIGYLMYIKKKYI